MPAHFTPSPSPLLRSTGRTLHVGFVALNDCAPLVMAEALGLYEAFGVQVKLQRQPGWATVRDKIIYGELDAAQAPAGTVLATALGIGCVPTPCVTGLVLNAHGNAITLSERLWKAGVRNGEALRERVQGNREERLTFGVAFLSSAHHFLLRHWLQSQGIHPDRDVQIVVVPPPQMLGYLQAGHLDGYCVGEPWNSMAVMGRHGWCPAISAEIMPRHPEKVVMVRKDFAEQRAPQHLALLAALIEAGRFCAAPENRERVMETLALPEYVGAPIHAIRMSMAGSFDFGHGRTEKFPEFNLFTGDEINAPTPEKTAWLAYQLHAAGLLEEPLDPQSEPVRSVLRPDIYARAVKLARAAHP